MLYLNRNQVGKKTLWTVEGIYALIALEFLYMATPFAAFFYSVYSPILNFTNRYPSLAWLNSTFLPHVVQDTSSSLLNLRVPIGIVLFITGILGFTIGAVQIYYTKIFRKTAVLGGLYRFIRHPQYLFLMIWGLGLVLLWPRKIVLIFYVTMIFIYYRLACLEEKECERKFGEEYKRYKNKTGMFFPANLVPKIKLTENPLLKRAGHLPVIIIYILTITLTVMLSWLAGSWSRNQLYAFYTPDAVYISITKINEQSGKDIIEKVLADPQVQKRLSQENNFKNTKYINYILPADMYMLEIPMNSPRNGLYVHYLSPVHSAEKIKIIFTQAEIRGHREVHGREILEHVAGRIPVMEVYIDLVQKNIVEIKDPPLHVALKDIVMPVY